ncbi:MAG TPA: 23S rRNA (adenine(2030)-N(6))-methyltransferase RlmJ [Caulobacteraceae bacterium]|nr:23S rRNA (adenine(2030)-N(6))-methyltransferase RlmJ [Caulobacteraceae bacterium]
MTQGQLGQAAEPCYGEPWDRRIAGIVLNYRHIFHAGNFADLVKHACLMAVLNRLTHARCRLEVIDTHAGAGVYDLSSAEAVRSGEAPAGVGRLLADPEAPAVFDTLKAEIAKLNPSGEMRWYPGSPLLIANALRKDDGLTACELRPDDAAALGRLLNRPQVRVLAADGYEAAAGGAGRHGANLVLIDPPFERGDEYARVLECVDRMQQRNASAVVMVWLPLKDLETFDGFLRGLEAMGRSGALVVEARLRRLDNPLRLNGCALAVINDPPRTEQDAADACEWVVETLGEAGGAARTWRL